MAYFPVSSRTLQKIASSRRFEDVAGFLVLSRFADGNPVPGYQPHRFSGAGVNALHEKLRVAEETAKGVITRLVEANFLREAQPEVKAVAKRARWDLMPEKADMHLPHSFVDGILQCSSPISRLKKAVDQEWAGKLHNSSIDVIKLDCLMLLLGIHKESSMQTFGGLNPRFMSRPWCVETRMPTALLTKWGATPGDEFFDCRFVENCLAHRKDLEEQRKNGFPSFSAALRLLKSLGLIYEVVTLFSGSSHKNPGDLRYSIRVNDYFAATNEAKGDPSVMGSLEASCGAKLAFYTQADETVNNEALRVLLPDTNGILIGVWRPRFRANNPDSGIWIENEKHAIASAMLKISQVIDAEAVI